MYIADLHIHSMYSRATSKTCVPEYLDLWARKKGIHILGTGDFTHPAWREELKEKLVPAEEGLYTLKEEFRLSNDTLGVFEAPRFVLSGEISSIYKKNGKTRKVHNVILLPSLEDAELLSHKLEAIGNIHSDGRPILGLDSHDLLEIMLETCPEAMLIPAHIWTPHFSLFGAFSGFDTIEECFEDLTPHIRALETGLSSDPAMNWRVSMLDSYTLVSNSDAHSPAKLGREANLLDIDLSYPALIRALSEGQSAGFRGTIEFFPEEGKYHHDGHRNCHLCLKPSQTREYGGKCPVCGKKITIGVLNRVEQLADREEGFVLPGAAPFESLVPLPEVIASSIGKSSSSAPVNAQYEQMLRDLGPEFAILREVPFDRIERSAGPCICEGIRRLREGRVERIPGFDGEYGKIQLLNPLEIDQLNGQLSLFEALGAYGQPSVESPVPPAPIAVPKTTEEDTPIPDPVLELNPEQQSAVTCPDPTVAVIAGPGTGKTKTLVARIAYLVEHCNVKPKEITAVTFTNQAAAEMKARLEKRLGKPALRSMTIGTFHSICLHLLRDVALIDEYSAREVAKNVLSALSLSTSPQSFLREVSKKKNGMSSEVDSTAYDLYCSRLKELSVLDFDDLLLQAIEQWPSLSRAARRFSYLLVDEFQDINPIQYQLVRAWSEKGKNLFVIGDPDQAIYGFRGSDPHCFSKLSNDFSSPTTIRLVKNYRSTPEIIGCALQVIANDGGNTRELCAQRPGGVPVRHLISPSDLSGAIFVAKEINRLVGGIDMLDAHQQNAFSLDHPVDFSDIAVLYRTHREARILEKCLKQESIPYCVAGRDDFLADPKVRGTVGFFQFLSNPKDLASLGVYLSYICGLPSDAVDRILAMPEIFKALVRHPEETASLLQREGYLSSWISAFSQFYPRAAKGNPRRLLEEFGKLYSLHESEPYEQLLRLSVFSKRMPEFLQNFLLGQERDFLRGEKASYSSGAVTLMTLHGSKGLEFPVVFLCGVDKGRIPLESNRYPTDLDEERRLFYVGMTRARDQLILLSSGQPSAFVAHLPQNLIQTGPVSQRKHPQGKQLSLFD